MSKVIAWLGKSQIKDAYGHHVQNWLVVLHLIILVVAILIAVFAS